MLPPYVSESKAEAASGQTGGASPELARRREPTCPAAECGDVEQRLRAEVDTALAGQPATYDDLSKLPLTGRIVRETLRLCPPVPLSTRITTQDTRLGDQAIAAGTTLVYSPYLIHHRPDTHPDADHFHPDRWTAAPDGALPRDAFFSFGGARKCIGNHFGLTEAALALALALATITARWELSPATGTDSRPQLSSTLRPKRLTMHTTDRTRRTSP